MALMVRWNSSQAELTKRQKLEERSDKGDDGHLYGGCTRCNIRVVQRVCTMVRACVPGQGGIGIMTVVIIATLFLFLYLIYALIHPEKF
ncbi:F subunit of K+-transporting ATPase [compost metagenome]